MKTRPISQLPVMFLLSLAIAASGTASAQQIRTDGGSCQTDVAFSQATLVDGRVISAGLTTGADGKCHPMIVRYSADLKSTDATFGACGIVIINTLIVSPLTGVGLAVQADGKLLVGATLQASDGGDLVAVRLLANGAPDATYGTEGVTVVDFQHSEERAFKMLLQPDGGVILGGFSDATHPGRDVFALCKLTPAGKLDGSWGNGGRLLVDFGGVFSSVYALTIDRQGFTVAAGGTTANGSADFAAFRLDTRGVIDSQFGQGGLFRLDFAGGEDVVTAVAVTSANDYWLVGYRSSPVTAQDFTVVQISPKGVMKGTAVCSFGTALDIPFCAAVDATGRLVAGGYALNPANGHADLAFVRFKDGGLDPSFGVGGLVNASVGSDGRIARALSIRPDGRLVVTGQAYSPATAFDFQLLVLNPNGTDCR